MVTLVLVYLPSSSFYKGRMTGQPDFQRISQIEAGILLLKSRIPPRYWEFEFIFEISISNNPYESNVDFSGVLSMYSNSSTLVPKCKIPKNEL